MNSPLHQRRLVLTRGAALTGVAAAGILLPSVLRAQTSRVRVGLMLPFTGTFAQLGTSNANGIRLAIQEQGSKLGGREVEFITLDDEADPSKAVENANKLVLKERVDVLIGTVHSGVQMGVQKVARESGVLNIIPNAGLHAATRALCAPNIFRSSFSNAQATLPLGRVLMSRGLKNAVWITWKYAAGDESFEGFEEGYKAAGGTIVKAIGLPFPSVEFQAQLSEIASLKPDVVVAYFAGGGAVKFIKDYAAAGLKGRIPLYGPGFLTESVLAAAGPDAEGIVTTLHYSDSLETPRNQQFRLAYAKAFRSQPDVYAVHGYDAGQLLIHGANAVQGDFTKKTELYKAMQSAVIESPRGRFTLSKAHNPVQDIYLRQVVGGEDKVIGVAAKAVADSGAGCRLAST
jgi:branched-chain amino acid transport system substrate-binding protein